MESVRKYQNKLKRMFRVFSDRVREGMFQSVRIEGRVPEIHQFLEYPDVQMHFATWFCDPSSDANLCLSSRVSYANALKQLIPKEKITPEVRTHLTDYICIHKRMVENHEKENKLEDKERERWYTADEIVDMYLFLNERIQTTAFETLSYACRYKMLQQRLLMALYIFHPPLRLDYGNVLIPPYSESDIAPTSNYLFERDSQLWFHLGTDKVAHKIGSYEFPLVPVINDLLLHLIRDYCPKGRRYLLTDPKDPLLPLDTRRNGKRSMYLLSTVLTREKKESKLCVDTLRSAAVTALFRNPNLSLADKETCAKSMRTSVFMMEKSYHKVHVHKHAEC